MSVLPQVKELLLQSIEHELGGVILYQTAIEAVVNDDLREEWETYLEQTQNHVDVLVEMCEAVGIDPNEMTPTRKIVQHTGKSLVVAIKMALAANDPHAAELTACECVVLAETKDHFNWELIGKCAAELPAEQAGRLREAFERVEQEEDEHLYHTKGWCRELWFKALGFNAELPPPEEETDVQSAVDAAALNRERKAHA